MRSAPIRKGSNIGTRRYTDSNENDDIEAIFPVPKNPTCSNTKKNSAILASDKVSFRKDGFDRLVCPLAPFILDIEVSAEIAIVVSSSLQITNVAKNIT
jgi:hypothetical protein